MKAAFNLYNSPSYMSSYNLFFFFFYSHVYQDPVTGRDARVVKFIYADFNASYSYFTLAAFLNNAASARAQLFSPAPNARAAETGTPPPRRRPVSFVFPFILSFLARSFPSVASRHVLSSSPGVSSRRVTSSRVPRRDWSARRASDVG